MLAAYEKITRRQLPDSAHEALAPIGMIAVVAITVALVAL